MGPEAPGSPLEEGCHLKYITFHICIFLGPLLVKIKVGTYDINAYASKVQE